jgi:hypothetical protein
LEAIAVELDFMQPLLAARRPMRQGRQRQFDEAREKVLLCPRQQPRKPSLRFSGHGRIGVSTGGQFSAASLSNRARHGPFLAPLTQPSVSFSIRSLWASEANGADGVAVCARAGPLRSGRPFAALSFASSASKGRRAGWRPSMNTGIGNRGWLASRLKSSCAWNWCRMIGSCIRSPEAATPASYKEMDRKGTGLNTRGGCCATTPTSLLSSIDRIVIQR